MKELLVKNVNAIEGQKMNRNGKEFTIKPVIPAEEVSKCRVNFVEVEPGHSAFSYHYHEVNEEVFYIISGVGIVRTINGDVTVRAGDAITFPTGEKGSHIIRNGSETEKLVYIDFDTASIPEIVHFPDLNQPIDKPDLSSLSIGWFRMVFIYSTTFPLLSSPWAS